MKKTYTAFLVTFILFITGCKHSELPADYVGTWSYNGNTLVINKNNTYQLTNSSAMFLYAGTGTYTATSAIFTLTDKSGPCNDSTVGTYNYNYYVNSISGTFYQQLTLTLVSDTCTTRASILPGTYTIVN